MCTYGTPWLSGVDASAAICYSNVALYICLGVGGWSPKCETRCNAGPPGIPSSRGVHPRDRGALWTIEKISVDSCGYLSAQRFAPLPPLSIFSIKRWIYHCAYRSPNFTLLRFIFPIQNISLENMIRTDGCPRMCNKFYLRLPLSLPNFMHTI